MAQISVFSPITPMNSSSSNHTKRNLLSAPRIQFFPLRSQSNTTNPSSKKQLQTPRGNAVICASKRSDWLDEVDYATLLDGLGGYDDKATSKRGDRPDQVVFASLLDGLIGDDDDDKAVEAVELFERIVKRGEFKPGVWRYGSFIDKLCKMGKFGLAIRFLKAAEEAGTVDYRMVSDRLRKDDAILLLEDIQRLFKNRDS